MKLTWFVSSRQDVGDFQIIVRDKETQDTILDREVSNYNSNLTVLRLELVLTISPAGPLHGSQRHSSSATPGSQSTAVPVGERLPG